MLTRCIHCDAWFRVRADQLRVAAGQVTCGNCGGVFNALTTLVEEPAASIGAPLLEDSVEPGPLERADTGSAEDVEPSLPATPAPATVEPQPARSQALQQSPSPPPVPGSSTPAEPVSAGTGAAPVAERAADDIASPVPPPPADAMPGEASLAEDEDATDGAVHPVPPAEPLEAPASDLAEEWAQAFEAPPPPSLPASKDDAADTDPDDEIIDHDILFTAPGGGDTDDNAATFEDTAPSTSDSTDDEDEYVDTVPHAAGDDDEAVPAAIEGDVAALAGVRRRTGAAAWAWRAAAIFLGAIVLLEAALVFRAPLIDTLPASRAWIDRLCELPLCPLPAQRAGAIELLAREVRDHPQYTDTLLVNATVVNRAAAPHPFPTIELILRDGNGQLLGARRFAPAEYLDDSIDAAAGMPPAQPVYLVLELGGDAAQANSFEFNFL